MVVTNDLIRPSDTLSFFVKKTKRSGANPVPIFRFVLSRDPKST